MRKLIEQVWLAIVLAAAATAHGAPAARVIRFGFICDVHLTDKHDQATAISRNAVPRWATSATSP